MPLQPATALDGPLADKPDLTVEEADPPGKCGEWPCEVAWPDAAGERHLYRFEMVSVSRGPGVPEYKFVPAERFLRHPGSEPRLTSGGPEVGGTSCLRSVARTAFTRKEHS